MSPRPKVLIISDDEIVRCGLSQLLGQARLDCIEAKPSHLTAAALDDLDSDRLPIVHVVPGSSSDHFAGVEVVGRLIAVPNLRHLMVVLPDSLPPLVRLRVIEAGATIGIAYRELAAAPVEVVRNALRDDVGEAARLPTRWALREALGLRWDGDLAAFLTLAQQAPSEVWLSDKTQLRLPISRRQLVNLRVSARDVAGLPAPDFHRYSNGQRSAPETPEWVIVRRFVRELWGRTGTSLPGWTVR